MAAEEARARFYGDEIDLEERTRMNDEDLEERKMRIKTLLESAELPAEEMRRMAEKRSIVPLGELAEKLAVFTAPSELLWNQLKDDILQKHVQLRERSWPSDAERPRWRGNDLYRSVSEPAATVSGRMRQICCLPHPRHSDHDSCSVALWKARVYSTPILDMGTDRAGLIGCTRCTALIALVVGLAGMLALVLTVAVPALGECAGYEEARCDTQTWVEVSAGGGKGTQGLNHIEVSVGQICVDGLEGAEYCEAGAFRAVHQCGPAQNILDGGGAEWLSAHATTIPGEGTRCFVEHTAQFGEGGVVLVKESEALSLPAWLYLVAGLIGAPLLFGVLCFCKPLWRDLCFPLCPAQADVLWGSRHDAPWTMCGLGSQPRRSVSEQ